MGKSIRSKVKRKFRSIKREVIKPIEDERDLTCVASQPDAIRPPGIEYKPNTAQPDPRVRVAAWRLAFPEKTAEAEAHKAQRDEEIRVESIARVDMSDDERDDVMDEGGKLPGARKVIKKAKKTKRRQRRAKAFW
mmetsp:Transcript_445/g.802  ORF Transcript_445/g.802 Transcript_445/m.802 type:complete len:135 (-) Transcript_445:74-478(-)